LLGQGSEKLVSSSWTEFIVSVNIYVFPLKSQQAVGHVDQKLRKDLKVTRDQVICSKGSK
jgi:hypothetical protein